MPQPPLGPLYIGDYTGNYFCIGDYLGFRVLGFRVKSLNSSNGVIKALIQGTTMGVVKGDTRSSDYGSLDFY